MGDPLDPASGPSIPGETAAARRTGGTSGPGDDERVSRPPDGRPMALQPAWRHDFPIDWPVDQFVERRDFMKFMVLTSGAFTLGQLTIAAQQWVREHNPPPERVVASLSDVPVGGALVFYYPGEHDNCLLVRLSDTELVAFGQKCTHLSCAVTPRVAEGTLHCPCHEGIFDLRTGNVLAGPPPRPLPRIRLEVRGDAIVATGIDWRTT